MKKIIYFVLVAALILSLSIPAFADYSTNVVYVNDASTEQYTVTVPAAITPGESKYVTAQGTWASNRTLTVGADESVTLVNSISASDTKTLAVTFAGITLDGSNTETVSSIAPISVEEMTGVLFGTWSGTFDYNVTLADKEAA